LVTNNNNNNNNNNSLGPLTYELRFLCN